MKYRYHWIEADQNDTRPSTCKAHRQLTASISLELSGTRWRTDRLTLTMSLLHSWRAKPIKTGAGD